MIGSGEACESRLPSQYVSTRHAHVQFRSEHVLRDAQSGPFGTQSRLATGDGRRSGLTVRDLNSKNGTFLNGQKLRSGEDREMHDQDVLRVGDFIGVVEQVPQQQLALEPWIKEVTIGDDSLVLGPGILANLPVVQQLAQDDSIVEILGEAGTGRERLARAIHHWSGRQGTFFTVETDGVIPRAHRGTVFVDEPQDLPTETQRALREAIQGWSSRSAEGAGPGPGRVKVVLASHEPLWGVAAAGRMLKDFCYRLDPLRSIRLLPLRERRAELPLMFCVLLRKSLAAQKLETLDDLSAVDPELVERLCWHDWPGNLRELESVVERLILRDLYSAAPQSFYRFHLGLLDEGDLPPTPRSGRELPRQEPRGALENLRFLLGLISSDNPEIAQQIKPSGRVVIARLVKVYSERRDGNADRNVIYRLLREWWPHFIKLGKLESPTGGDLKEVYDRYHASMSQSA